MTKNVADSANQESQRSPYTGQTGNNAYVGPLANMVKGAYAAQTEEELDAKRASGLETALEGMFTFADAIAKQDPKAGQILRAASFAYAGDKLGGNGAEILYQAAGIYAKEAGIKLPEHFGKSPRRDYGLGEQLQAALGGKQDRA